MIVKILGILDIFVAIFFWVFMIFNISYLSGFVFLLGLFLLAKGIVFVTTLNIASILDIMSSVIIIGSSANLPVIIVIIVSLFLLQKGIFSLL